MFLRTIEEVNGLVMQRPFKSVRLSSDRRFCVVFTKEPIQSGLPFPISSTKKDIDLIGANQYEAFLVWHIINGRPPYGKFDEEILPSNNTVRFYHTLN